MAGTSLWEIQAQHCGLHSCQGIQSEEPAHDPPAGPADLGAADVRAEPPQGAGDGAADPQPRRHEGVRLQGGGGVPRVSVTISVSGGGWRVVPCPG